MEADSMDFGDSPAPVGSTEPSDLQQASQPQSVEATSDSILKTTGNITGEPPLYDVLYAISSTSIDYFTMYSP